MGQTNHPKRSTTKLKLLQVLLLDLCLSFSIKFYGVQYIYIKFSPLSSQVYWALKITLGIGDFNKQYIPNYPGVDYPVGNSSMHLC
jgi:hypothetical protein